MTKDLITSLSNFTNAVERQHAKLEDMLCALENMSTDSIDSEEVSDALTAMMDYAKSHFKYEEDMMRELEYPRFKAHKNQHYQFLENTTQFCLDVTGKIPGTHGKITTYLREWLKNHIETEDAELDKFLIELKTIQ